MIRILIVDDHEVVREGLKAALSEDPRLRVVGSAGDARTALGLARQLRPDIALVDLRLPDLAGNELCARIREHVPSTAVVVLSTYLNERTVRAAYDAGAVAFVAKAAGLPELRDTIARVRDDSSSRVETVDSLQIVEQLQRVVEQRMGHSATTSQRQRVLELAAEGFTDSEIGERLFISRSTVRFHLQKLKTEFGARSKTELVATAIRTGVVPGDMSLESE